MAFDDFTHIEKDGLNFYECKTCGEVVPSGIINISGHWVKCAGKDFLNDIIKAANNKTLTVDKVNELTEKYSKP